MHIHALKLDFQGKRYNCKKCISQQNNYYYPRTTAYTKYKIQNTTHVQEFHSKENMKVEPSLVINLKTLAMALPKSNIYLGIPYLSVHIKCLRTL